jgi:hypothetical protein
MIQTGIATFRIRSFGRFRLTGDKLEYLGKVEELDLGELMSEAMLEILFNELNLSKHTTVHGAVERLDDVFAVDPAAVTDVEFTEVLKDGSLDDVS